MRTTTTLALLGALASSAALASNINPATTEHTEILSSEQHDDVCDRGLWACPAEMRMLFAAGNAPRTDAPANEAPLQQPSVQTEAGMWGYYPTILGD